MKKRITFATLMNVAVRNIFNPLSAITADFAVAAPSGNFTTTIFTTITTR